MSLVTSPQIWPLGLSASTKAEAENTYKAMLAGLRQERGAAQTKSEETAAELARLKARDFWSRLFGS